MSEIKPNTSAYAAAHMWAAYNFGKPQECENCHTNDERMYHWANISKEYKHERSDWLRLCVPCHKGYDIAALGGRIKARPKLQQPTKECLECGKLFAKPSGYSHSQWQIKQYCSRKCGAAVTARKNFGKQQSSETRALKSEKLRERWQDPAWREKIAKKMAGNKYASKH